MKRTLQDKEQYQTPRTFICDICAAPVLIGQTCTLFIYTYINNTFPIYFDEDEGLRTFEFKRSCTSCGEHHDG